jgi:molecular chaperone GrpE (heat shock protein)
MSNETPAPVVGARPELHVWSASEKRAPLAVIEDDMVRLLRELSATRLAVEETGRAGNQAQKRLLIGIAEALDGMQRVVKQVEIKKKEGLVLEPVVKAWLSNLRTATKHLSRLLSEHEVKEFEAGATFDPHEHRVLETRRDANLADGAIVETTLPGYRWQGEILRPAQVIVVESSADDEADEELTARPD